MTEEEQSAEAVANIRRLLGEQHATIADLAAGFDMQREKRIAAETEVARLNHKWMTTEACERTKEIETARKCAEILRAMPARGLYRAGGGYHPPSYDDAWRIAEREIRNHFGLATEPPK